VVVCGVLRCSAVFRHTAHVQHLCQMQTRRGRRLVTFIYRRLRNILTYLLTRPRPDTVNWTRDATTEIQARGYRPRHALCLSQQSSKAVCTIFPGSCMLTKPRPLAGWTTERRTTLRSLVWSTTVTKKVARCAAYRSEGGIVLSSVCLLLLVCLSSNTITPEPLKITKFSGHHPVIKMEAKFEMDIGCRRARLAI